MSGTNPAPRPRLPWPDRMGGASPGPATGLSFQSRVGGKGRSMGVSWLPSLSRGPVQSAVIEIDWMLFFLLQM